MSRNGSGTYSLPAGNPVVTGTTISSTWANNTLSDIATALTQSIASDGQTTPTANLPMGGFKHTGVAVGAALTDYARYDQLQNSSPQWLSSVAGTDTITASAPVTPAAYAAGQIFRFVSAGANTGAVTLNVSGIGAKSVTKNGTSALAAGDITSGSIVEVSYDGTQFQLIGINNTIRFNDIQNQNGIAYTTGGTSTAYTLTPVPAIVALATNQEFDVTFHTAAGATPTLSISGTTAKSIKYRDSTGAKQAITSTQVPSGWTSKVFYDGTDYVVVSIPPTVQVTKFTSTDQTITSGGALTIAHGLGVAPFGIRVELVNVTAEANYTTGQVVSTVDFASNGSGTNSGISLRYDTTNIYVRFGSGAACFSVNDATTGAGTILTNANWKIRIKAWV